MLLSLSVALFSTILLAASSSTFSFNLTNSSCNLFFHLSIFKHYLWCEFNFTGVREPMYVISFTGFLFLMKLSSGKAHLFCILQFLELHYTSFYFFSMHLSILILKTKSLKNCFIKILTDSQSKCFSFENFTLSKNTLISKGALQLSY